jgi:hypothetical protein
VIASSSRSSRHKAEESQARYPAPVVGGDGVTHHHLGFLSPAVVSEGVGVEVQDGVCGLSGGQLAQRVQPTMAGQQFGAGGEGVLSEVAILGYVLTEDPDRFAGAARAFPHPGLELLRVRAGVVPPALVASPPSGLGVRGDQLQHPLVTFLTFGDPHQGCLDPRLTDVRHEQVDGLVDAPCPGEQLGEVTAHGL